MIPCFSSIPASLVYAFSHDMLPHPVYTLPGRPNTTSVPVALDRRNPTRALAALLPTAREAD